MKYTKRRKKMSQQKFLALVLMVSVAVMIPSLANALILGDVEGAWSGTVGGTSVNYPVDVPVGYGNGLEDQVRWGEPHESGDPPGQSGLGFTGVAPPATSFDIGETFEVGQLRHFNNPVDAGTAASQTQLTITMDFDFPDVESAPTFTYLIDETPNEPGPPPDDDIIDFQSAYPGETFEIDGIEYTLKLLGFGDDPGSIVDNFVSPEGTTNETLLWGEITTPVIPEPTTIVLMGFGLLGVLGFVIRQRRKNQS
jgi:hypothetical protein